MEIKKSVKNLISQKLSTIDSYYLLRYSRESNDDSQCRCRKFPIRKRSLPFLRTVVAFETVDDGHDDG